MAELNEYYVISLLSGIMMVCVIRGRFFTSFEMIDDF